jgi:hypothetical protein
MSKHLVAAFMITGLVFACGAGKGGGLGSGVQGNKKVIDLTPAEIDSLCAYISAVFPEKTVTCTDGPTTPGTTKADCISTSFNKTTAPGCTVTVDQSEACAEAFGAETDAQICAGTIPTACTPLFSTACNPG